MATCGAPWTRRRYSRSVIIEPRRSWNRVVSLEVDGRFGDRGELCRRQPGRSGQARFGERCSRTGAGDLLVFSSGIFWSRGAFSCHAWFLDARATKLASPASRRVISEVRPDHQTKTSRLSPHRRLARKNRSLPRRLAQSLHGLSRGQIAAVSPERQRSRRARRRSRARRGLMDRGWCSVRCRGGGPGRAGAAVACSRGEW